jgi:secreted PhoX family phosphatase
MTTAPMRPTRPTLPITPVNRHGSRSRMTCLFRCGNACDHPEPNQSDHGHIQQEITRALQRRSVLKGAAIGSGALVVGGAATASTGLEAAAVEPARAVGGDLATTAFAPVRPNKRDNVTVAAGFTHSVVMRWGDRVVAGAPEFDAYRQTVAAARTQFGYNCDYVGILPLGRDQALLVVNHEYTDENLMFPIDTYTPAESKAIAMANHGMSVVTIRRGLVPGDWQQVKDLRKARHNRRLHLETPFAIVGPAAGDARLKTVADPTGRVALGTLNNCAGGTTPWGTVLSGEENFNQYFLAAGTTPEEARYGLGAQDARGWRTFDPRFDATTDDFRHEPNRFGWIVEVDPEDPDSVPVKHTAMGRFKHEGATVHVAPNGHVVAYMGDDERFDYVYKFVSQERYDRRPGRSSRRHNLRLLSAGDLYVARFAGDGLEDGVSDGTGQWIPLTRGGRSMVPGMSIEQVLVYTRLAADKVAATKMDRPEDVQPNPVTGKIYVACTNNTDRGRAGREGPTEPNPRNANKDGHVVEITEDGGDHTGTTFTWNLILICGDTASAGTYFGGWAGPVSPISCPDNVAFDSEGNLWVSTDGQPSAIQMNDGLFKVPVAGPERGRVQQFLAVPAGAETCGPVIHDQDGSVFVAVQHPGEDGTWDVPQSYFPDYAPDGAEQGEFSGPRPSVVQVTRR